MFSEPEQSRSDHDDEIKETKREDLQLKLREVNLIIEALKEYYLRRVHSAQKSHKPIRPRKVNEDLGFIQETLQHMMYYKNLREYKINETSPEASDNIGDQELAGDKGTDAPST